MAKKPRAHHKKQPKWLVPVMIGLIALLVVMLVVNAFLPKQTAANPNSALTITADGHVHTADGQHVGTYEEMFGQPWEEVIGTAGTETADAPAGEETAPAGEETAPAGEETAPAAE